MEYIYNKNQKEAVSSVSLGMVKERHGDKMGERRLTITTRKGYKSGTLRTEARVNWHGDGVMSHCFGLGSGGDYSAEIITTPCARVTEKAIIAQHSKVTGEGAEPIAYRFLEAAKAYYSSGKDKD